MANSPINAVEKLRAHVAELMSRHSAMIARCSHLEAKVREQERTIISLRNELDEVQAKCKNLVTAQAVVSRGGDVAEARDRFEKLVREIDTCISLLNE